MNPLHISQQWCHYFITVELFDCPPRWRSTDQNRSLKKLSVWGWRRDYNSVQLLRGLTKGSVIWWAPFSPAEIDSGSHLYSLELRSRTCAWMQFKPASAGGRWGALKKKWQAGKMKQTLKRVLCIEELGAYFLFFFLSLSSDLSFLSIPHFLLFFLTIADVVIFRCLFRYLQLKITTHRHNIE